MSRRWRWILVVVTAATVGAGFMPRLLSSGAQVPVSPMAQLAEEPTVLPGCMDAVCGKGAPAPAAPSLTIAALGALIGGVAAFSAVRLTRRFRSSTPALARGAATRLFHPPQFSPFDLI
jgi:hypothetical protein